MARTVTPMSDQLGSAKNLRHRFVDVVISSYTAGGESLTAADFGFNTGVFWVAPALAGGLTFEYDYTNAKLIARFPTGGATTAPTTLANPQVTSGASTASAVNATTPALTPGIGKEVAATANLSAVPVRIWAVGY